MFPSIQRYYLFKNNGARIGGEKGSLFFFIEHCQSKTYDPERVRFRIHIFREYWQSTTFPI